MASKFKPADYLDFLRKRVKGAYGRIPERLESVRGLRDFLNEALELEKTGHWKNLRFTKRYGGPEDSCGVWWIEGERWETHEEAAQRLRAEEKDRLREAKYLKRQQLQTAKAKQAHEKFERKEYERLKKKFEGT